MKTLLRWFALSFLFVGTHALAQSAGTVTYVYTDPQGTPLAEADASGNITATFEYTPYGTYAPQGTSTPGPAPKGPGYTGHVNDPETNLVYMQARYYDPATGHFLSVDPVGPAPGNSFNFNRYAYVNNNPIVHIDADGREAACVSMGNHCGDFANNLPVEDMVEATRELTEPLTAEFPEIELVEEVVTAEKAAITVRAEQGAAREAKVAEALKAENPGASVQNQQYLRTADGKIAKDPLTGQARRVDHAVIKDGKASTYETTSMKANKTAQSAKEQRIRQNGGTYVRDRNTGKLVPVDGQSQIRREQ